MEPKEVMDFLKSDKNVKELGEKLEKSWNMNAFDRNKNQKFFDAVNNATLNNTEFQNKIKEKIKSKK
jgi:thymidylate synthase